MNDKPSLRSMVCLVVPLASSALLVGCVVAAVAGVELPLWAYWTLGGLIAGQLLLALAMLTVWPERREEGDSQEGVPDEVKPFDQAAIRAEAPPAAGGSVQEGPRWRWRR
jgi:hypothetical protein